MVEVVVEAVVFLDAFLDCFAEADVAGDGGVAGDVVVDCFLACGLDVVGGVEVGFADGHVDDVDALGLEFGAFLGHRECRGWFE